MSDFVVKQQSFWEKMDNPVFWKAIKPSKYIHTPCSTITKYNKVGEVYIDRVVQILWDCVKLCVLIQDGTNWYHLSHTTIHNLTVRQVVQGIVSNEHVKTIYPEEDVLDIHVDKAPPFKVIVLDAV